MIFSRSKAFSAKVPEGCRASTEPNTIKAARTHRIEYLRTPSSELVGGDRLELPTSTV
jgi:hypothetical protein